MLAFFVSLCVLLGFVGLYHICLDLSIHLWPRVNAKVTSCDINTINSSVATGLTVHCLYVAFEYEYKGRMYYKGRVSLSGSIKDKCLAKLMKRKEEILSGKHMARVSPFRHSLAVLYPDTFEVKLLHYFFTIFGFGVAALTLFIEDFLFASF